MLQEYQKCIAPPLGMRGQILQGFFMGTGKDVICWYTLILLSGCDIGGRGWILEGSTYSACKLMGSKWSAKTLLSTQAAH